MNRRDFVKTGIVTGLSSQIDLSAAENVNNNKSVIWIWLGGGPSQFETFHATEDSPEAFSSVNGIVGHKNGLRFGGLWKELIKRGDDLTSVNSFSHNDASHLQATHFMMTGQYNAKRDQTASSAFPSHGSIVSAVYGSNRAENGMPTYVKQGTIQGEEGAFLGGSTKPFDPSNKENLIPKVDSIRINDRRSLLSALDSRERFLSENAESFSLINNQAFDVILGNAKTAFDIDQENELTKRKYGPGIGAQLLLARRLTEYGSKFVTVHYGSWDMHSDIESGMQSRVPPLDIALSFLIDDLKDRGRLQDTMIVVTGEFGRTKINASNGRDHWSSMTPLLIAGGDYQHGKTVGTADKSYVPTSDPFGPIDLARTLFDHFDIDPRDQRVDSAGRPRYLLDGEGRILL